MTMRRLWLVLLLCASARPAGRMDGLDYLKDLVAFNTAYGEFFRSMLGCPKHAREIEECNPKLGTIDYGAYARVLKLADRVFPRGELSEGR